ncbi:MAG: hypothetical protein ACN6PK_16240, partial [Pseudomonas shirazensis]
VQPKLDSEDLHHLILRPAKRPARTIPEILDYGEIFFSTVVGWVAGQGLWLNRFGFCGWQDEEL